MNTLPSISIVVPNYNQGKTLAKALRSLIEQDYPNLQIVVIDGGSTDNSVEIIRSFEPYLSRWVSEPDRGQTHAINKGLAHCTGELFNWLCGDDWLEPGALRRVGEEFVQHPDTEILVGGARFLDMRVEPPVEELIIPREEELALLPFRNFIPQASAFLRRRLLDRQPPLDESYHYMMDFELWSYLHFRRGVRWRFISEILSTFAFTGENKSSVEPAKFGADWIRVCQLYGRDSRLRWDAPRRWLDQFMIAHANVPGIRSLALFRRAVTVAMMVRFGARRIRFSPKHVIKNPTRAP